jgi:hypothetical protein
MSARFIIPVPGANENFKLIDIELSEVKSWFHVYNRKPHGSRADTFAEGWGDTRFSPIRQLNGDWVHTYYAASTIKSTLSESVLHDVSCGGQFRMSKLDLLESHIVEIEFDTPLKVVSFHSAQLDLLSLTKAQLIDSHADVYSQTRRWAEAAFLQRPQAQGVGYTSKKNDTGRCVMLFKQRLTSHPGSATPFKIIQDVAISSSDPMRKELMSLMDSQDISWV